MDEPWLLRIKIHVLLNLPGYLCGRDGERMMCFHSVRFVGLEVCGLGFWMISRSTCECSWGLLDSTASKTAQLARAGLFYFWHIPWPPPLENISHLSLCSLWVCAWSWSPGMEAPSMGRRLLLIPFFHQQIRRVSLFLIDFTPLLSPSLSFALPLSPCLSVCLFCFHLLTTNISNPHPPTLCLSSSALPLLN